jgi:hypothetical protein
MRRGRSHTGQNPRFLSVPPERFEREPDSLSRGLFLSTASSGTV